MEPGGTWRNVRRGIGACGGGSERGLKETDAPLADGPLGGYDSRLSQKARRSNEIDSIELIELFDNREWNQNVRGELEVARRPTGAGGAEFKYLNIFNDSDALSYATA
jgi:hypothetical protein